jgi:hypothetical protein
MTPGQVLSDVALGVIRNGGLESKETAGLRLKTRAFFCAMVKDTREESGRGLGARNG